MRTRKVLHDIKTDRLIVWGKDFERWSNIVYDQTHQSLKTGEGNPIKFQQKTYPRWERFVDESEINQKFILKFSLSPVYSDEL